MLPTFMSWVSSTIGVVCLAFTDFEFNKVFFFRPLIIVMMVTYFIGCYFLPALLCYLDFDVCRLGKVDLGESMFQTKSIIQRGDNTHNEKASSEDDSAEKDTEDKSPPVESEEDMEEVDMDKGEEE